MKISVKVKPNSKENAVEKTGEREFSVRLKAPAKEGKANEALLTALSEYFNIPKSLISIITGRRGKLKIINIS